MTPASLALVLLFVAIPAAIGLVLLRRVRPLIGLVRQLSDPAGVGALLSPATREALARAGHDPDALRAQSELSPELRRMISADVTRAFRTVVARGAVSAAPAGEAWRASGPVPPAPGPTEALTPPPPYAAPEPGAWLRWAAAAAIIAAAALYLALGR